MMQENQLPEGWVETALDSIVQINMGQSPSSENVNFEEEGLPFLQGKSEFRKLYPVIKKYCTSPKKIAEKNDILLSIRAPVGPTNLAHTRLAIGRGLAALSTGIHIDHKYLIYYFRHIEPWLTQQGTGTTFKAISAKFVQCINVKVTSCAEQKEIANRLDTLLAQVDKTKAHLERVPQIMKKFRQSVLNDAVSGRLTKDWRQCEQTDLWVNTKLKDHVSYLKYGSSSKSHKTGLVPVLRMGNIQNGRLDWSNLVYSSDQIEIAKYQLNKDDILFNRTNSPELVGKTAIYKGERNAIYAGYLIAIRCEPTLVPDYLNYHLNSPQAKVYCKKVKSDGVSQSNINAKKISDYSILLPSIKEQKEIVKRIEKLFKHADEVEQQAQNALNKVNKLTQSILAKAFRGELTKTWRAENPELITGENSAEALLEKIKQEREAAKKKPKKQKKVTQELTPA